ncbi:MAG: hypothetical protein Q9173_003002 [Seirophora scorigena]
MATSMKKMQHKLRERSSFKRRWVRLKWTLDKEEVQDLDWRFQIQTVMQQDLLKLTMKSLELQIETKSDIRGIALTTVQTRDVTQGIALTADKTAEQTQRIETVTQRSALTSDAIVDQTQRIESVRRDYNNRLRSIEADSLALRLRKEEKDKENLHRAIADWLSRLEFNARHTEIYDHHIDISQEFIESPEFQAWSSGRPWILFCWADAGAGKITKITRQYKKKARGVGLSLKELQEAFCSEIMHYERVFVIVDALDEGSSKVRQSYADILQQQLPLGRQCIMITSRESPPDADQGIRCDAWDKGPFNIFFQCQDCTEPFDLCYDCKDQRLDCGKSGHTLTEPYIREEVYKHIDPSERAIREYVRKEIHGDVQTHRRGRAELGLYKKQAGTTLLGRLCQKDDKLEAKIVENVYARADRNFLLAKLYVESLRVKLNKREIMDALQELLPGYSGVYETTMERIKAYTIRLKKDFSEDDIYDEEEMLKYTAGLVTVATDNGAVRVAHYTVQQYFMGFGNRWLPITANVQIVHACLHYMSIDNFSSPCDSSQNGKVLEERKKHYPFMRYAYECWGDHTRDTTTNPDTIADALTFLKDPLRVATLVQAVWYLKSSEAAKWEIRRDGLDVNAKDPFHEQTPLIYASRRGHSDTVAKLIELGAFINNRSARGRTSLVEAVSEGHLPVVQALLNQYRLAINEIQPCDFGRSVLMLAVINNDLDIVDVLRGRQDFVNVVERLLIDTSIRDQQDGATALIRAVDYGNLGVIELLLDRNVGISQKDHQDRGLLHAAAINDRCGIAKSLIEKGIPINVKDKQDRTPLHDAARCGNEAMVRLLLERGADFHLKDSSGRAPAIVAWQNGRTTAFQLLEEKSIDSTETPDSSLPDPELLPVWSLAKLSREDIIERTISQRSRDPFVLSHHLDPDTDDTPIHCAISAERPSILRLLLSADLSPDTQNALCRSPLHLAAESSITTLIEILLSAFSNLDSRDVMGMTPLFHAYTSNRPLTALMLVEAGAEIEEKALILLLFFAAIDYERIGVVKMLMKRRKAPILAKNKRGESALQIAKARGLIEIQRLLNCNKSYANNRSLAFEEREDLDLTAPVRGPFTRPEVSEEEEHDEREKGERLLRLENFPAIDAGAITAEVATDKAKFLGGKLNRHDRFCLQKTVNKRKGNSGI